MFTEDLPAAVSSSFAAEDFQIDWNVLPQHIKDACCSGRRPSPQLRREFIRKIGDQLINHTERSTRALCLQAARQIVLQHPVELGDVIGGVTVGCGYYSLVNQLKARVENQTRNSLAPKLRSPRQKIGHPQIKQAAKHLQTTSLQLEIIDKNTQEDKRLELIKFYQERGPSGGDEEWVTSYILECFILIRSDIEQDALSMLKLRWPFFFQAKHLLNHFEKLTEIDPIKTLDEAITQKGQRIMDFLMARKQREYSSECSLKNIVVNLQDYFKEARDSLFIFILVRTLCLNRIL